MKKVKIKLKVNSSDTNYIYNGMGTINKDLVEFTDNDDKYLFDITLKRIIKSNKDSKIIIDFNKECVIINALNNQLEFKIKVIFREEEKNYKYKYELEKNIFEFLLEVIECQN